MECDMEYFRLITNMNYKAKNMFTELNIYWTVFIIGPMHFNWFDASLHVGGGRCMLQFCGMLHGWLVAFVAKSESAWERKRERGGMQSDSRGTRIIKSNIIIAATVAVVVAAAAAAILSHFIVMVVWSARN